MTRDTEHREPRGLVRDLIREINLFWHRRRVTHLQRSARQYALWNEEERMMLDIASETAALYRAAEQMGRRVEPDRPMDL